MMTATITSLFEMRIQAILGCPEDWTDVLHVRKVLDIMVENQILRSPSPHEHMLRVRIKSLLMEQKIPKAEWNQLFTRLREYAP